MNKNLTLLHRELSLQTRYGLAIIFVVFAFILRILILPVSAGLPFVILYPATVAAFYLLGTGPGLVTTALSALSAYYAFIPPHWSFAFDPDQAHIMNIYLAGSTLTGIVIHKLQNYAIHLHSTLTKLQDSENRFRSFMDCGYFLSWMKSEQGNYVYTNRCYQEHFQLTPEDWQGKTDFDLFSAVSAEEFRKNDQLVLQTNQAITAEEISTDPNGVISCWMINKFPYTNTDGTRYVGGIAVDISERKAAEEKIESLAFYDPLTNLPNRRLLLDRLSHVLNISARHRRISALLFIDLDNFKTLNDTHGHNHGDQLLQQVAQRLQTSMRKGDTLARFGGDEFVILLENLSADMLQAATRAEATGEKILQILSDPYLLDGTPHRSTPSIGITLFGDTDEAIEGPLKRADLAMYQAKAAGRNTLRFFDPQIQAAMAARSLLEADLRSAIATQQFTLHYQPQITNNSQLTGAEALVRWQHPTHGLISPLEFIPLAEDTGLILPLGRWVLDTACAQLAQWATQPGCEQLSIAVNVSPRQFRQLDFVEQVMAAVTGCGANPRLLKLELTESLLVSSVDDVIKKMVALKAEGISFSLDDFGTGYSSLAYLKQLPLDQLKIDQSFVKDILIDANDAVIAKTIIALANSLGLNVIAEGVETEEQRDFLSKHGCTAYQGYLFSRPLPIHDFNAYANNTAQS